MQRHPVRPYVALAEEGAEPRIPYLVIASPDCTQPWTWQSQYYALFKTTLHNKIAAWQQHKNFKAPKKVGFSRRPLPEFLYMYTYLLLTLNYFILVVNYVSPSTTYWTFEELRTYLYSIAEEIPCQ